MTSICHRFGADRRHALRHLSQDLKAIRSGVMPMMLASCHVPADLEHQDPDRSASTSTAESTSEYR